MIVVEFRMILAGFERFLGVGAGWRLARCFDTPPGCERSYFDTPPGVDPINRGHSVPNVDFNQNYVILR